MKLSLYSCCEEQSGASTGQETILYKKTGNFLIVKSVCGKTQFDIGSSNFATFFRATEINVLLYKKLRFHFF